jgi:protein gp37
VTAIEWTDETWNPVVGCSKVSEGCDNCYAELVHKLRLDGRHGYPAFRPWTPENAEHNVTLRPDRLGDPAKWRKPRMVFVNSMSDLFHPRVPSEFINDVWMAMFNNPRHTYQVLTKRPKRLRNWTLRAAEAKGWPADEIWPDWIWVGTSIESRDHLDRADLLRETPAAVRFISAEPLLGPLLPKIEGDEENCIAWWPDGSDTPCVPYDGLDLHDIAWLIVGGESGPEHRPMDADWVRDLRDAASGSRRRHTAFFFKQWGGRTPKAGGRELDGRTWDEFPEIRGGRLLAA